MLPSGGVAVATDGIENVTASRNACAPRWHATDPTTIRWERFGDHYAAYHRPSGKTHFLNGASRTLLCDILSEPKPERQVAAEFAGDGDELPAEFGDELRAMLERFEQLGLVRRS